MDGNGTPHVLFVYYSFTQQTRRVADTMADTLRGRGYDVTEAALEFTDPHYGERFSKRPMSWPIAKITGMLPAQVRKKTGDIKIPPAASGGDYDLVVIGSPTWWLTTCMPVRSYMHDPASGSVLAGKPFAVFSTSRRYYKGNLKTIRELGVKSGGKFVDDTHFVAVRQSGDVDVVVARVHAPRRREATLVRRSSPEAQPQGRLRASRRRASSTVSQTRSCRPHPDRAGLTRATVNPDRAGSPRARPRCPSGGRGVPWPSPRPPARPSPRGSASSASSR